MHFVIKGKIKPYVRMTQRGKWVRPDAQEYLASKDAIAYQLRSQMGQSGWEMIERGVPIGVEMIINVEGGMHRSDLDNQIKAVLDAANEIVYDDDRWVDSIKASRGKTGENVADLWVYIL